MQDPTPVPVRDGCGDASPIHCLIAGAGVAPDPLEIERALAATWQAASREVVAGEPPITRTCTGTLVVLAARGTALGEALEEVVVRVTAAYPVRVIAAEIDVTGSAGRFDASYSAFCRRPLAGGRHQICCEQVLLEADAASAARVSAMLLALLVADLPVTVWLAGALPLERRVLAPLLEAADRLVVDSNPRNAPSLEELQGLARLAPRARFTDLAWLALAPWRRLVADLFDTVVASGDKESVAGVEIAVGCASPVGGSPLLLAGWLASRLGWRVRSRGPAGASLELEPIMATPPAASGIRLAFDPVERAPAPLAALRLETRGVRPARYTVGYRPDGSTLEAAVEVEGACPLPSRLYAPWPGAADLLCAALEPAGRDIAFDDALAAAQALEDALAHARPQGD